MMVDGSESSGSIGGKHAATTAVMGKIQQAMQMFGDSHVGNLILREGVTLEYETSIGGEVAIVNFANFDSVTIKDAGMVSNTPGVSVSDPLTRDEMQALFDVVSRNWREEIRAGGLDGPVRFEGMNRYRAHIFLWGGEQLEINDGFKGRMAAFIRIIPGEVVPLKSLGLPPYMTVLADANCGLLLVVGPTGSGKTTTTVSYIDHINGSRVGHIITIEDPIEWDIKERRCRVTPREVGTNVKDLETGVRDAMREIPLAIMVGEIRDAATLNQTFRAARSGHYVAATRHAPNAVSAVRALIDELPGDSNANAVMVAETLLGVIYQVRIPSVENGQWEFAHESLNVMNNGPVQGCIAKQDWNTLRGLIEGNDDKKSELLNVSLLKLILDGKITEEAADRRAYDRVGLRSMISKAARKN
jgi:twitching motility protein PilT